MPIVFSHSFIEMLMLSEVDLYNVNCVNAIFKKGRFSPGGCLQSFVFCRSIPVDYWKNRHIVIFIQNGKVYIINENG